MPKGSFGKKIAGTFTDNTMSHKDGQPDKVVSSSTSEVGSHPISRDEFMGHHERIARIESHLNLKEYKPREPMDPLVDRSAQSSGSGKGAVQFPGDDR